jgi:hypothetical protein
MQKLSKNEKLRRLKSDVRAAEVVVEEVEQVSISSTFFRTNVVSAAFSSCILAKNSYEKRVHKMLMKLTVGSNSIRQWAVRALQEPSG